MSQVPRDEATATDARLRQVWRDVSRDEPASALDAAIRAAARKAVQAGPQPAGGAPFGGRWRVPLSVAAVLVVSATVTLLVAEREKQELRSPHEQTAPPAVPAPGGLIPEPAQQPRGAPTQSNVGHSVLPPPTNAARREQEFPRPVQPAAARGKALEPMLPTKPAGVVQSEGAVRSKSAEVLGAPGGAALEAAPAEHESGEAARNAGRTPNAPAAGPSAPRADTALRDASPGPANEPADELRKRETPAGPAEEAPLAQSKTQRQEHRAAAPAAQSKAFPASPGMTAPSGQAAGAAADDSDPKAWLERILTLRREGKLEEAARSLKAFRERYPDYPVPAALKDTP
jgi:hypothetical protein